MLRTYLLLTLVVPAVCSGCSMAAFTGDMLSEYTWRHATPYLMSRDDSGMACAMGVSTAGLLLSYERVTDAPDKAAIATMMSAGSCSESEAWESELRYLRALRTGNSAEARDARIAQRRAHATTARRQYEAWQRMVRHYGAPKDGCPVLEDASDELAWLSGNLAGSSAVQHDRAAGGIVNVPLDIPKHAARGIRCLDSKTWFGVPLALEASIWLGIPGSAPEGKDPYEQLELASRQGLESGVRLATALQARAAFSSGNDAVTRSALTRFAAAIEAQPAPNQWRLLDAMATDQARAISDFMWTDATGYRTPFGALGTFWDDAAPVPDDDASLLDDLMLPDDPKETP